VDAFSEKPEGRMSRIPTRRPKLQMTYRTRPSEDLSFRFRFSWCIIIDVTILEEEVLDPGT
jgi:hypothetical protein